jgi:hypothetical protein
MMPSATTTSTSVKPSSARFFPMTGPSVAGRGA